MAIWEIPRDKIIDYSPTGDDIDTFSQKTKYCLEEAFISIKELHDIAGNVDKIGGSSVAITDPEEGQTLVYNAQLNLFENKPSVNLIELIGLSTLLSQEVSHLQRLVENLYLVLDVAGLNPGGYDGLSVNTFFSEANDLDKARTFGNLRDGKYFGENVALITKPLAFINERTGLSTKLSKIQLVVKHKNVLGEAVTAEIASRPTATFVKGELLGTGTGSAQTVQLAHPSEVASYKYSVYFNGVRQEDSIALLPRNGEVTFTAPEGVAVHVDYFYNWGEERFLAMTPAGTYQDQNNPNRATTQFVAEGDSTSVATIKIRPKTGVGESFWIDSFSFIVDE